MPQRDILDTFDEGADTLRLIRAGSDETSIYDLRGSPLYVPRPQRSAAHRRLIRATRQNVTRLREALAAGWDIGPELAYEERRLANLEAS